MQDIPIGLLIECVMIESVPWKAVAQYGIVVLSIYGLLTRNPELDSWLISSNACTEISDGDNTGVSPTYVCTIG